MYDEAPHWRRFVGLQRSEGVLWVLQQCFFFFLGALAPAACLLACFLSWLLAFFCACVLPVFPACVEPRQRDPMVLEDPVRDAGLQVDIRGDSKTGEEEKVIVHFHCQLGQCGVTRSARRDEKMTGRYIFPWLAFEFVGSGMVVV